MKGGYYIISNVLDVEVPLPSEISPLLRIAKADDGQVAQIQSLLTQMSPGFMNPRAYYENHWVHTKVDEHSSTSAPQPLVRKDWRYFVLGFSGTGTEPYDFFRAANLVKPTLRAFAQVHTEGEFGAGKAFGRGGDQVRGVLAYELPHSHRLEVLNSSAIGELGATTKRFQH
jgi:hypothetical protein